MLDDSAFLRQRAHDARALAARMIDLEEKEKTVLISINYEFLARLYDERQRCDREFNSSTSRP